MKKQYLCLLLLCFITIVLKAQNVNTNLSNLTSPTKANVSLLPSKDSSLNLGNNTKSWKNVFLKGKIYFSDTPMIYSAGNSDFFAGPNAGTKFIYLSGARNTGMVQMRYIMVVIQIQQLDGIHWQQIHWVNIIRQQVRCLF